jgi:predicted RecA/RadA family phage recombinase
MNTQINKGRAIEITAGGAIPSGTPVKVGSLVGIASNTYANGDTAVIWLEGTHLVPKTAGAAWTAGELLYWDATANSFTGTSSSNTFAGYAYAAALSGDITGYILLRQ